jgi:hypothetical protein
MNLVSTSFATQPVCNAARAAHALRSDQYVKLQHKRKNNELSGHFVCHAACLKCRTGSACTSLGPIRNTYVVQYAGRNFFSIQTWPNLNPMKQVYFDQSELVVTDSKIRKWTPTKSFKN